MELRRGSMLIDADDLSLLTEDFINSNHSYDDFVCISTWTIDAVALSREWGQTISKHIDMLGLKEGEFIKPPLEKVLYFPYIKELNEIRYLVELVKPSLDHSSIWSIGKWKTLGQGEGAALGIALRKLNIDLSFFEKDPFVPRKRMPAI